MPREQRGVITSATPLRRPQSGDRLVVEAERFLTHPGGIETLQRLGGIFYLSRKRLSLPDMRRKETKIPYRHWYPTSLRVRALVVALLWHVTLRPQSATRGTRLMLLCTGRQCHTRARPEGSGSGPVEGT